MITPSLALWILTGMTVLLVVVIPLLDSTAKLSSIISFRWTCVAVLLILMVAVVLDFDHLSDNTRDIILQGGLIIVGSFLLMRTVEKIIMKGFLKNTVFHGTIQKGDIKASVDLKNNNVETATDSSVKELAEDKMKENKADDVSSEEKVVEES